MDNKQTLYKMWIILNSWRLLPVYMMIRMSVYRQTIEKDIEVWGKNWLGNRPYKQYEGMALLLLKFKEFRNLVFARLHKESVVKAGIFKCLFRPLESLYIYTGDIGDGLFVHHGFATIIAAEKIGCNCWINQQVTIGHTVEGCPSIGDNVKICAGAIVVGKINIGSNVLIGAGSVVTTDIPDNEVWAGVPAHRISSMSDYRIKHNLESY